MKKFIVALLLSTCSALANPFVVGSHHKWSTSAGQSGTMRVASVDGNRFLLEQTNVRNLSAGVILMNGEILHDGSFKIINKKWNEVWVGRLSDRGLVGRINAMGSFCIEGVFQTDRSYIPFGTGLIYGWDTSVGKGTMQIVSTNGLSFNLLQYNDYNRAAGAVPMSGEILPNGEVVIRNPRYNEIWRGFVGRDEIVGKVNDFIPFRISDIDKTTLVAYHRHYPSCAKAYSDFRKKTPHFDSHTPYHAPKPKLEQKKPYKPQLKTQPKPKTISTYSSKTPKKPEYKTVGQKQPYFQKSKKSNAKQNSQKKNDKNHGNFFDDFKKIF